MAQAQPRASELLVAELCADGEMVEILIDPRGQPVAPDDCAPSLCPDCIPVPPLAVASAGGPTAAQTLTPLALTLGDPPVPAGHRFAVPLARGPPDLT